MNDLELALDELMLERERLARARKLKRRPPLWLAGGIAGSITFLLVAVALGDDDIFGYPYVGYAGSGIAGFGIGALVGFVAKKAGKKAA